MLFAPSFFLLVSSTDSLKQALALFNSGKYQESYIVVAEFLRGQPDNATAYKLLGMDQFMLGHPREALASVTHATELAPHDSDALYYLGRLYFDKGDMPAALNTFQKSLSFDASNARAYNYLGQSYEALGKRADAEKAYLAAISIGNSQAKQSPWPNYNLGVLYLDDGRVADSIPCFRRALDADPAFVDGKVKLAVALSKSNPVPEAFDLLRQALTTDPENAEAHYRLALLLTKAGKTEEARQQFALFEKYRKP